MKALCTGCGRVTTKSRDGADYLCGRCRLAGVETEKPEVASPAAPPAAPPEKVVVEGDPPRVVVSMPRSAAILLESLLVSYPTGAASPLRGLQDALSEALDLTAAPDSPEAP